jgi:hypothetical protein
MDRGGDDAADEDDLGEEGERGVESVAPSSYGDPGLALQERLLIVEHVDSMSSSSVVSVLIVVAEAEDVEGEISEIMSS